MVATLRRRHGSYNDNKGMQCIAKLLASPNKGVMVFALMGTDQHDRTGERSIAQVTNVAHASDLARGRSFDPIFDAVAVEQIERARDLLPERIRESTAGE